ncbi:hypothetical protein [Jiella pelagia]|uniref:Flagellar hook-length control protein FliK n=1 Tax=Jiella pelagia TaxID=2986949 RepID=A0ABY7BVQ7_9HYPH|nr:hypothetical protein [Jiella pelagia]WAP67511.1 hypothetical protein OH818_18610 [Jiella pelagia]
MTVARGLPGDVSATAVTGRKPGRENAVKAQEAGGFAAAMRGLGAAPGDKNAAATTNAKAADRAPMHSGRKEGFAGQHENTAVDRGVDAGEAKGASRLSGAEGEATDVDAEGVVATARPKKSGTADDKQAAIARPGSSEGADSSEASLAEDSQPETEFKTTKREDEVAAPRGRSASRTEQTDGASSRPTSTKDGAQEAEGGQDADATATNAADAKTPADRSKDDAAHSGDATGRQLRRAQQALVTPQRDPELVRLRLLQSGLGAENATVELQLSAEEVADRLGITLPGEAETAPNQEVAPTRSRSGRIIVTVGRGEGYALEPIAKAGGGARAASEADAVSAAPLSPDSKLAAILGGFGLESRIVAANAAEPQNRPSRTSEGAVSAGPQRGGDRSAAAPTPGLRDAGEIQPHDVSVATGPAAKAAPAAAQSAGALAAQSAAPAATSAAAAGVSQDHAPAPAAAGRASFIVPEPTLRDGGRADAFRTGQLPSAANSGDAAGMAGASRPRQADRTAIEVPRVEAGRLTEQPASSRPLGRGARVDLVSMRTDFEPATRRAQSAGNVDAPAGRAEAMASGNAVGAAPLRNVLAGLDEVLAAGAATTAPAGRAAGTATTPAVTPVIASTKGADPMSGTVMPTMGSQANANEPLSRAAEPIAESGRRLDPAGAQPANAAMPTRSEAPSLGWTKAINATTGETASARSAPIEAKTVGMDGAARAGRLGAEPTRAEPNNPGLGGAGQQDGGMPARPLSTRAEGAAPAATGRSAPQPAETGMQRGGGDLPMRQAAVNGQAPAAAPKRLAEPALAMRGEGPARGASLSDGSALQPGGAEVSGDRPATPRGAAVARDERPGRPAAALPGASTMPKPPAAATSERTAPQVAATNSVPSSGGKAAVASAPSELRTGNMPTSVTEPTQATGTTGSPLPRSAEPSGENRLGAAPERPAVTAAEGSTAAATHEARPSSWRDDAGAKGATSTAAAPGTAETTPGRSSSGTQGEPASDTARPTSAPSAMQAGRSNEQASAPPLLRHTLLRNEASVRAPAAKAVRRHR